MKSFFYLLLFSSFLPAGSAQAQDKPARPNILYIMADDHTSQAWGIYGGILKDYVQNKNIKRLAARGTVLENVFCTNSICVPSRAAVLTGEYSHKNLVYTLDDALDTAHANVAKQLHAGGYQTAIIGKWHLKNKPTGFDYFNVLPGQGVYHNPRFLSEENWNDREQGGKVYEGYSTDLITGFSLDWLNHRDTSRPFFLMCHFKATHEPFDFAERFRDLYKDVEFPYPASFNDWGQETTGRTFKGQQLENLGKRYQQASEGEFWTNYPELPFSVKGLDSVEARKKIYQKFIRDYLRCAAGIDENLGRIMQYLDSTGLSSNTIVIYTADQGYFLGEHGFFDKRLIYEESLRMPFIIVYPPEVPAANRLDDIVLNIDFPALFLDYAGLKKPANMQGESFRQNLAGNTPSGWRQSMYYRYWTNEENRPAHIGIRTERYTLALFYGRSRKQKEGENGMPVPGWEFYDLKNDVQQTHNLIKDDRYREIIKKLKKQLLQLRKKYQDTDVDFPYLKKLINENWND